MTAIAEPKYVHDEPVEALDSPGRKEILAQCTRIAESEEFRAALSQQKLLRYLVTETLDGRGAGLKEYSVGLEVFQRSQDFDPRTDAIVRVSVGQLRRRLAAYYSMVGVDDRILIQVPKGHYSAEFGFKEPEAAAEPSTAVTAVEPEAELPKRVVKQTPTRGQRWVALWVLAAVVLSSLVTFLLVRRNGMVRSATAVDLQNSLLWSTFLQGDTKAVAVIGLASTAAIGPVVVRSSNDNDDQSMMNDPNMQKIATMFNAKITPYSVYTGIGEALAAGRMQRAFLESSLELSMLPAHDVQFRDLHGQNVIFLSSLHFRDIRKLLQEKRDFDIEETGSSGIGILNHAPKAGEQSVYRMTGDYVAPSVDYALISIGPGTATGRRILEIGGTGTLGTAGAAQYLTERQSLAELDAKLKQGYPGKQTTDSLQVLLRVDIVDHQVVSMHYVTHHWIK